jgi:N-acetylmuramoyl-L-alanine amidase
MRNSIRAGSTTLRAIELIAGVIALLALDACAPLPQRAGIPTEWRASPNHNERKPNFVILHYTSDATAAQSLATLRNPSSSVSAHYLVARDGSIYQLVDERQRAWHAGESRWGSTRDLNSSSIGIELDNNGREAYDPVQIASLLRLLRDIVDRYQIPPENILGHGDIAPRRKPDPGPLFPWELLAEQGFGLWCKPPYPEPSASFDPVIGLRALGYDLADTNAAITAFKAHFAPDDAAPGLSERSRALINCLNQRGLR